MSHIVKGKVAVRNRTAIEQAVESLAMATDETVEMVENAVPRYFGTLYGHGTEAKKCELVLKLPGMYDLGFKLNKNGEYEMVADSELFSGGVDRGREGRAIIGLNASSFLKEYHLAAARLEAEREGLRVSEARVTEGGWTEIDILYEEEAQYEI